MYQLDMTLYTIKIVEHLPQHHQLFLFVDRFP
jgi:hypothetical protein